MAEVSLARIAGDYITLVQLIQQAQPDQLPDADGLRRQILGLLGTFASRAREEGFEQSEIEEARFALTVWVDETILRSQWPGREAWPTELLQTRLFHITRGGNEFYEHLAALSPERHDAREIYFIALVFGFEGQYAGQESQRTAVIQNQFKMLRGAGCTLNLTDDENLLPSAYELDIELPKVGGLGFMATLGLGVAALTGMYGLLWLLLYLIAGDVPLPPGVS